MSQYNNEYCNRINRVINYLRDNLYRSIKLEELARVACFSEFHFHRIFGAVSGETLNNFTGRLRLEKATRLLRGSNQSVIDIALECGFSSPATFSRVPVKPLQMTRGESIKKFILVILATIFTSQVGWADEHKKGEKQMPHVTGIGGVFFKSKDAKALTAWYAKNLGITIEAWGGSVLRWKEDKAADKGATAWNVEDNNTDKFSPSQATFMINYRRGYLAQTCG
jgi:AraC-like DNA-binding protein